MSELPVLIPILVLAAAGSLFLVRRVLKGKKPRMPSGTTIAASTAISVLIGITFPLYREFYEPGLVAWNVALALFLVGMFVATAFLGRFFAVHAGEIGEARFDTRNKGEIDG